MARPDPLPLPPRVALVALLVVLAGVAAWLRWSPLDANDVVAGDEGYYGTMARNVLAAPHQLVSPSLTPLGPPGDKPPLYPALLALSVKALGPTGMALRWPSIACAALVALGVAALAGGATGPFAAVAGAAFLITLPWFGDASRSAEGEIPLTAFGVAALVLVGGRRVTVRRAALAGVLLGLAFLCKLWLVSVFALAAVAAIGVRDAERRQALAACVLSACAVGGLQLAAVALLRPADLPHWLRIYFGFSLLTRVHGEGYAPWWIKPPLFYAWTLLRAFAALLPLVALGVVAALRRRHTPAARAVLVWSLGTLVLSAFAVKSAVYAYVVVPAWAALAAIGAGALAAGETLPWPVLVVALAATFPPPAAYPEGVRLPLLLWGASWGAVLAAGAVTRRAPAWAPRAAVVVAMIAVAIGVTRSAQRLRVRYHDVGYRAVAAVVAPALADVPPGRVSFVAPEAPAFAWLLFRSGAYWHSPALPWSAARRESLLADPRLRVFVIDPTQRIERGWPDSTTLARLERSTREVTAEVARRAGRPIFLRVFVRGRRPPSRPAHP